MDSQQDFGMQLRTFRRVRSLSLTQLSALTHFSKGYLSKIENGARPPTHELAVACDRALELDGVLEALVSVSPPRAAVERKAPVPVPAQLPSAASMVGRSETARHLFETVTGMAGRAVVIGIDGMAGVGKTTMALHVAYNQRDRYPDGALYCDLQGHSEAAGPLPPGQVLGDFLRALGVEAGVIPDATAERSKLLRSTLNGRRVLMVLDNAATSAQVRPLLPGAADCLVLVTSRSRLAGLAVHDHARLFTLDPLEEEDALALLRARVGGSRVDSEPGAATDIVRWCARLPLALAIAADLAAERPHVVLADLAADLAQEPNRLNLLASEEDPRTAVSAAFSRSHATLAAPAARAFRLLALHPGRGISAEAAGALLGTTAEDARRQLRTLVRAHLLTEPTPHRYGFHDLLLLYAMDKVRQEEPAETRRQTMRRSLEWYLHTVRAASQVITPNRWLNELRDVSPPGDGVPTFTERAQALLWCETERRNLIAAVDEAAALGMHAVAWQLAAALVGFLYLRKHRSDWDHVTRLGLASAMQVEDLEARARMHTYRGGSCAESHDYAEAIAQFEQALSVYQRVGDTWGQVNALSNLGDVNLRQGRYAEALVHLEPAAAAGRDVQQPWIMGILLNNLGEARVHVGRCQEAVMVLQQALVMHREIDNTWVEAITRTNLGIAHYHLAEPEQAVTYFDEALRLHHAAGNEWGEGWTLHHHALCLQKQGYGAEALEMWKKALTVLESLGDPLAETVRAHVEEPALGPLGPDA
ncbi:tetratricopeptide repeat protein [Streptomyces caelestis]|uniref:tetratricopeptide repeat protein n=1 Tax=Streptomyces caelestis TaxID=36816 RepID=UPI00344CC71D